MVVGKGTPMFEFKLADIGEGMQEGDIVQWLVGVGDFVNADDPIVTVQTDKVTAELPAPVAGKIDQIFFREGATVPVGSTLVHILANGEEAPSVPVNTAAVEQVVEQSTAPIDKSGEARPTEIPSLRNRALATPHVRSLAREMQVDIEQVTGSGKIGRVTEEDIRKFAKGLEESARSPIRESGAPVVERATSQSAPRQTVESSAWEERIPLKGVRKRIAEHMVKSATVIPHVTHVDELEVEQLKGLRERLKPSAEAASVKLTFLPFFVKAVVIALREFPMLNASMDDEAGDIIVKHFYHIGIATDTDNGLIVPVVKNADKKTILELAKEISELSQAARTGQLQLSQISGGTFTISNVGSIGGLYATPIINHPEAAILGLHKMEPRTVVRDGESVIRTMMNVSLSFDHRIIDGAMAVRFTNLIRSLLENPESLFLRMS